MALDMHQPVGPSLTIPLAVARDHLRRQATGVLKYHSVLDLPAAQDTADIALEGLIAAW